MKKVLILSSKNGSNFEAIIKYFKNRTDIVFKLLCDNKNAYVIKRAKKLKIETFIVEKDNISSFLENNKFDLLVMAGFFKILDKKTVQNNKVINIHPSILPKYKGLQAIKKAFINKDAITGITIHYANEYIDDGEIIFQKKLKIDPKWSYEKLEKEVHKLEHYYYPKIIEKLLGVNVLIVGSGAREHALASKIIKSKYCSKLYLADANDGFSDLGEKIEYINFSDLTKKAKSNNINLAIIGSEGYLEKNIVNFLNKQKIKTIGADRKTAKLEYSKLYAKKIMNKYGIKTSKYRTINNEKNIDKLLSYFKNPVIKADGLAMGKGVFLSSDKSIIKKELKEFLKGKYGNASKVTIIEERLYGDEISLFSFWDGKNLLHMPLCRDYKQNKQGENTGGLGAICPIELNLNQNEELEKYKQKIKNMLIKQKITCPFILYSGLMLTQQGIYVLEYNVRLGDPETQVLLNYVDNDWLEIFFNCANKMLDDIELKFLSPMNCIVLASKGYPNAIKKGVEIKNIDKIEKDVQIYYSNIIKKNGKIYSNGGRVLSVVSSDKQKNYKALEKIEFNEKMYRDDI